MSSSSLEVTRRPRTARRSKWWRVIAIAAAVVLVVGWLVWYLRTPEDLPVTDRTVDDIGTAGTPLYIGMFVMPEGDRRIDVSGVEIDVSGDGVEAEPVACRGGSVSVTPEPENNCDEVGDPLGELRSGDSIMIRLDADTATEVTLGRIEISFREGIRWGTKEAGIEEATISFGDRPTPPPVDEESDDDTGSTDRPGDDEDDEQGRDRKDRQKGDRDRADT